MTLSRLEYILISILLLQFISFSPFVVEVNIEVLLFGLTSVLIFMVTPLLTLKYITSKYNLYLNIFLLLMIFNAFWSYTNHNGIVDILRSILPFLYLYLLYIASSALQIKQFQSVLKVLFVIIYFLAIKDFIMLLYSGQLFNPYYRVTFDSIYSALPYNILLILYILFYMKSKLKYLILLIPSIIIFQSQSKGLIGITSLIILFYSFYSVKSKIMILGQLVFITLLFLFLILNIESIPMLNRFTLVGTDSDVTTLGRLQEIGQAISYFLEHPFIGNGAGTVFLHVFDDGTLEERRYTHNVLFYFLAIGGIPMVLSYLYLYLKPMLVYIGLRQKSINLNLKKDMLFIVLSLSVILLYSMVSATYKLIHTNVILGLLLAYMQILRRNSYECTNS